MFENYSKKFHSKFGFDIVIGEFPACLTSAVKEKTLLLPNLTRIKWKGCSNTICWTKKPNSAEYSFSSPSYQSLLQIYEFAIFFFDNYKYFGHLHPSLWWKQSQSMKFNGKTNLIENESWISLLKLSLRKLFRTMWGISTMLVC